MILVLLGTQNNNFNRLLEKVEENIINGNIKEEVIVQAGYTKYTSNNMKIFDMISKICNSATFLLGWSMVYFFCKILHFHDTLI